MLRPSLGTSNWTGSRCNRVSQVRSGGQVIRSGQVVRSAGQVSWSGQVVRSAGQVRWSGQPVRSGGQVSRSGQPVRSAGQVSRSGQVNGQTRSDPEHVLPGPDQTRLCIVMHWTHVIRHT